MGIVIGLFGGLITYLVMEVIELKKLTRELSKDIARLKKDKK